MWLHHRPAAAAVALGLAVALHAGPDLLGIGLAGATPARAADLTGPDGYPSASPYEDPRYGDIYRHPPPPRVAAPYPDVYRPPYGEPGMRDRDGYLREMDPPRGGERYGYRGERPYAEGPYAAVPPYADGRRSGGCLPREVIRDQLERQGWAEFQDADLRGNIAYLRARRVNGRWYDLTLNRCSGQVLDMHAADRRAAQADDWRLRDGEPRARMPPGY